MCNISKFQLYLHAIFSNLDPNETKSSSNKAKNKH